jgi:hypothetical protein
MIAYYFQVSEELPFIFLAGHCLYPVESKRVYPYRFFVMFGGMNIKNLTEENWIRRDIRSIFIHPDYGKSWSTQLAKFDSDIAVVGLERKLRLSNDVKLICLPPLDNEVINKTGFVVGHGLDENQKMPPIAKQIEIKAISAEKCVFLDISYISTISRERMFCAGGEGKVACIGDSGGGFYVLENNSWDIYGLVSAAILDEDDKCHVEKPTAFTMVPKFVDWINKVMETQITLSVNIQSEAKVDEIIEIEFTVESNSHHSGNLSLEYNCESILKSPVLIELNLEINESKKIHAKFLKAGQLSIWLILKLDQLIVDSVQKNVTVLPQGNY